MATAPPLADVRTLKDLLNHLGGISASRILIPGRRRPKTSIAGFALHLADLFAELDRNGA